MKSVKMKGKNVEEATRHALEVLGGKEENAKVIVLNEGKSGMLGIGAEEAEVEVVLREGLADDAKRVLQDILDKMEFMAVADGNLEGERVELVIKGEDMGQIIGKDGATLKSLEILVSSILGQIYGERVRVGIDADGYKDKRKQALERLAKDVLDEVSKTGEEKVMPPMNAADRRIVHLFLQDKPNVTTYSKGEGRDRRLVVAPR
ncbi:MAG: KH domain-containing protein [Candidatus Saganbacteria bacterium]|nr:KH domain-containing protein [Candidatus Saganbacteria bacterium]